MKKTAEERLKNVPTTTILGLIERLCYIHADSITFTVETPDGEEYDVELSVEMLEKELTRRNEL